MNKIAKYLQTHISGEVVDSVTVRDYFSTDMSVAQMRPQLVAYPRTTNDIRKIARFSWQLGEKGHSLPITARGGGTDLGGAAIGSGIVMVLPAHLNKVLELDTQQRLVRVQPGVNFKVLQETLQTHGLFLPAFPSSYVYSTIGGAIANNTSGEKSFKYGPMRDWIDRLEVVLANGEVIQTGRISKKQVEKKKGLTTLEGELYRAVDAIDLEYGEAYDIYCDRLGLDRSAIGYNLYDVVRRDGSIDLTPLFVGSQGTLGVVSEAILKAAPYAPKTRLIVAGFASLEKANEALVELRKLRPSVLDFVHKSLLDFAKKEREYSLPEELVDESFTPEIILFVEFDDAPARVNDKKTKRAKQILSQTAEKLVVAKEIDEQEKMWAVRDSATAVVSYSAGGRAALPMTEDASVVPEKFGELVTVAEKLTTKYKLPLALWGNAGDIIVRLFPLIDLSKPVNRQTFLKFVDEYYRAVIGLGGTISAVHGEGRVRVPFARLQTGEQVATMNQKLKAAFDPHGVLNPGVKTGTTLKEVAGMFRHDYSTTKCSDYLPRV